MIISLTLHCLLLHLVFSLNVEEVSNLLKFWGCLWLLMIFVVSSISLIFVLVFNF